MRDRRPIVRIIGVGVSLALLLVGCGSDSDSKTTASEGTSTTSTAVSSTVPAGPLTGAAITPTSVPPQSGDPALLTAVRTSPHSGYDRLVFEFNGPAPGYAVGYVTEPITNADTGATIPVEGSSILSIRLTSASSVDLSGAGGGGATYTGPKRFKPSDTPVVNEVVQIQEFEGTLTWAVGLRREAPFKVQVLTGPSRVVIDFAAGG